MTWDGMRDGCAARHAFFDVADRASGGVSAGVSREFRSVGSIVDLIDEQEARRASALADRLMG